MSNTQKRTRPWSRPANSSPPKRTTNRLEDECNRSFLLGGEAIVFRDGSQRRGGGFRRALPVAHRGREQVSASREAGPCQGRDRRDSARCPEVDRIHRRFIGPW